MGQGLVEVGGQVAGRLQADGQAQQPGTGPCLRWDGPVGQRRCTLRNPRNRRLFSTTKTDENAIAALVKKLEVAQVILGDKAKNWIES